MITVNALLFRHYVYQEEVLEGNTDLEKSQSGYDRWANFCVVTAITAKYLRIELPDKNQLNQLPVSHYADYKILKGLWVVFANYSEDTDKYYWCSNRVQAILRKWICRARCSGPYLIHMIDLKGVD